MGLNMPEEPNDDRMMMVRALASYDRNSDRHKKIYEDLAEE